MRFLNNKPFLNGAQFVHKMSRQQEAAGYPESELFTYSTLIGRSLYFIRNHKYNSYMCRLRRSDMHLQKMQDRAAAAAKRAMQRLLLVKLGLLQVLQMVGWKLTTKQPLCNPSLYQTLSSPPSALYRRYSALLQDTRPAVLLLLQH